MKFIVFFFMELGAKRADVFRNGKQLPPLIDTHSPEASQVRRCLWEL